MEGWKNVGLRIFEEIMNENVPEFKVYMDPENGRTHCTMSKTNDIMEIHLETCSLNSDQG